MSLAGLMRAGTEEVLCPVAVMAKDLEVGRETATLQPLWESAYRLGWIPSAMLSPVVVDVVDGKERSLALATANAFATISSDDFITYRVPSSLHARPAPRCTISVRGLVEGVVRKDAFAVETSSPAGVLGKLPIASARAIAVSAHPLSLVDGFADQTPRWASAKFRSLLHQAAVWAAPHSTSIAQGD